jgi:hypothetical protein
MVLSKTGRMAHELLAAEQNHEQERKNVVKQFTGSIVFSDRCHKLKTLVRERHVPLEAQ